MYSSRTTHTTMQLQRGAVFIVMLVILIMGVTIYLVSALSKATLQNALNEKNSDLLGQAKEVMIGYALNGTGGSQRPGDLLIPDVLSSTETPPYNYDGVTEGGCLDASKTSSTPIPGLPVIGGGASNWINMRCLGRLPWKSFSMPIASPSDNDSTGFMPWYAVSANLVDPTHVILNSELLNTDNYLHSPNNYPPPPHPWLTVHDMNGNVVSDRVAFIIFIPGAALPGQSRPTSPNLGGVNQYLDSITVPATCTAPCVPGLYNNADMDDDFIMGDEHRWINDPANPGKQIEDSSYHFNDKLLYVTIDELMPLIEKRIGREVKTCLDDYAMASSSGNYPWAAPAIDSSPYPSRLGVFNALFGRISDVSSNATSAGGGPYNATTTTLLNALTSLQQLLNNYPGSTSNTTLKNSGISLANAAQNANTLPNSVTNPADTTGDKARDLANGVAGITNATVQSWINTTNAALVSAGITASTDNTMPSSWSSVASCNNLINASTYWNDWRDLVFYQVSTACQPGSTTCNTAANLSISGSGNPNLGSGSYRAAVIMAGKKIGTQTRPSYTLLPNDYLANTTSEISSDPAFVPNAHNDTAPATTFITYKPSDPYYQSVNDLVLCIDGKNKCK